MPRLTVGVIALWRSSSYLERSSARNATRIPDGSLAQLWSSSQPPYWPEFSQAAPLRSGQSPNLGSCIRYLEEGWEALSGNVPTEPSGRLAPPSSTVVPGHRPLFFREGKADFCTVIHRCLCPTGWAERHLLTGLDILKMLCSPSLIEITWTSRVFRGAQERVARGAASQGRCWRLRYCGAVPPFPYSVNRVNLLYAFRKNLLHSANACAVTRVKLSYWVVAEEYREVNELHTDCTFGFLLQRIWFVWLNVSLNGFCSVTSKIA